MTKLASLQIEFRIGVNKLPRGQLYQVETFWKIPEYCLSGQEKTPWGETLSGVFGLAIAQAMRQIDGLISKIVDNPSAQSGV